MKNYFLMTNFKWPTPDLLQQIVAVHPWSGAEKRRGPPPPPPPIKLSNVDRYVSMIGYFGTGLTGIQTKRFSRLWLNGNLPSPSSASRNQGLKLSDSAKKPSKPWKDKKFGFIPNPQSVRAKFLSFYYESQWKWSQNAQDFVKKFHSEGRRQ